MQRKLQVSKGVVSEEIKSLELNDDEYKRLSKVQAHVRGYNTRRGRKEGTYFKDRLVDDNRLSY